MGNFKSLLELYSRWFLGVKRKNLWKSLGRAAEWRVWARQTTLNRLTASGRGKCDWSRIWPVFAKKSVARMGQLCCMLTRAIVGVEFAQAGRRRGRTFSPA